MGWMGFILAVGVVVAIVSFAMAIFIRSNSLAVTASAIIAESLVILFLLQSANPADAHESLLETNIILIVGTPIFFVAAAAFSFLARLLSSKAKKEIGVIHEQSCYIVNTSGNPVRSRN